MSIRKFIIAAGLLSGVGAHAGPAEPRPAGIDVRMTIAGPVFVDARGMTLYQRGKSRRRDGVPCPDRPETVILFEDLIYDPVEEFPMRVPDAGSRRSCIEKYPPLVAPAGAKSVGHWTIHQRESGIQQWTYRGSPLHLSIKDKQPGDIHADDKLLSSRQAQGWEVARAPLEAPAGIETRLTALGLAFTNHEGRVLYHASARGAEKRSGKWKPVLVPMAALVKDIPSGWSIVKQKSGLSQWAWRGKPLYTYASDTGDVRPRDRAGVHLLVDIFGDPYGKPIPGWNVAVLVPASAPPAGVHPVSTIYDGSAVPTRKIYADANGKTLYVISCTEMTRDRLDCDDVGDSPRHWLSFCGGEKLCRKYWQPLRAPRNGRPIDGLWSVALINPSHPYKPLENDADGVAVWTFRGRIVATYSADEKPGDTWGSKPPTRLRPDSSAIPAFTAQ